RQQALGDFKTGRVHVLVATDIAARGIDIAGLSHVFNYDLPNEPEAYVHRIGRTGRAGRDGIAISFCCVDELKELKQIEKLTGKTIRRVESEWPMQVLEETPKQPRPARAEHQPRPQAKPAPAVKKPQPPKDKPEKAGEKPPKQPSATPASQREAAPKPPVSQSRATPLQRPVSPARREPPVRSIQRDEAEKPAFTYADLLRQRRKGARRPLSTGNDRF
ncbi:MAG: C-terminal helicase domain-containing protein, partial [Clostridia bacterium]|nr:C-terminal helicase domain-containing protein [Clostridia bacterium]